MKRFLIFLVATLFFGNQILIAQQQIRYNYGNFAAKVESGSVSMQVSPSVYSTQNLKSGTYQSRQGFLSVLVNGNVEDSLALVDLYNATNPGDTAWTNADGWLTLPLNQWYGVQLNAEGRVTSIDLNNNNLNGTLPQSFKNLDSLVNMYFYVNPNLGGELFDFIRNLPALERISAHDCNFTGPIYPEAFQQRLIELRIFNNFISDTIPPEIVNAPSLDELSLNGNELVGQIPPEIGQLRKLRILDLSNNMLEGGIPIAIGQMDSLQFLYLENLNLGGEVPIEILNCPSLIEFWFSGNNFTGTLPDVLNMPNFRALQAGGNRNLLVDLPDNLGELTQLEFLSIWNTKANGGAFPEGVYNLTNLYGLDLSEQQFTGTIDQRIGNLINLNSLYLRNNLLEGAFPIEITSAGNLNTFDISSNNFDFMPDISALPNLQTVNLSNNQLQFESLIPYLAIVNYNYSPQRRIGTPQDIEVAIGASHDISSAINAFDSTNYQWILNGDSLANAINNTLTIDNFTTAKSGRYILRATHPSLVDLVLNSAPINLKIAGGKTNWYVDNRAETIADFRNLSQAVAATKGGDTLYIAGSNEPYTGAIVDGPRVFIGPGYFLEENPETQFNKQAATVDFIDLTASSDGSAVYGISARLLRLNNQSSSATDVLENVNIVGNNLQNLTLIDKNDSIRILRNIIGDLQFASTTVQNAIRSYDNFDVRNNIIDTISTFFDIISPNKNSLGNMVFDYNNIRFINDSINGISFSNSIVGTQGTGTNTFSNNIAYEEGLFTNSSGTFSVDNDYIPIDASLAQGAYAGTDPYQLSGLPPVPSIYNIVIGARLSAKLNVKSNNENNIARIRYLYRRNNQSTSPYSVRGFTPSTNLEVEFLPNRSGIEPNQIYDLVFQAVDATGKRSHRTYIPYETIAANLSGNVVDIDNVNVNEGNVRLFAINPFANKYDTAAVQSLAGSSTFNFENLILGDYIILADPDEIQYPNLIPTYLGNTLDWQVADTLFLQQSISGITINVEKEPEPLTEPGSEISGIIEEEFEEADSSLRFLPRKRVSGAGVSVRRLTGSSRPETSLRLLDNDYELVAYVKTDENGEFTFPNLPSGDYRIRVEYPGVETDETSDIDFNLSGEQGEVVSVEAVVEDGKIKVTETGRVTANNPDNLMSFSFYPNPVKNILNLNLENALEANQLIIFDIKGVIHKKIQLQNGQTQIDLNHLAIGSYIIRLQDGKGNYVMSKMIKY
ncbi:T9SS type A sorting domain-containing protein [Marivirga sp.]|uniref:T9SS type A sorting domain-containing protein n=1 Tax=Marivirga sp. TaxID=2018662 RepID=UPI0025E3A67C|nr:T9SS type A sorting domain-containing protein [Marivirga sp.]